METLGKRGLQSTEDKCILTKKLFENKKEI